MTGGRLVEYFARPWINSKAVDNTHKFAEFSTRLPIKRLSAVLVIHNLPRLMKKRMD